MARLRSELELSLTDHVSAGARRIDRNLENLRNQQMRSQQAFAANRDAMLATVAVAYVVARAVQAPVQASIDFSTQLEDVRQMSNLTQKEIEAYGDSWRQVGLDTAQGAESITNAVKALAASGAVSIDQADAIAGPIGRTATAYAADPNDVAQAAGAVMNTLKVSEDEIGKVFDIMAVGALNGSVELKNMAGQFGILASSASSFGMEGTAAVADLVAMLEIAATTSGTPDKAFTNMNAFLASVQSPAVRKAFQEMGGINIVDEMNRAVADGESPLEHALGLIDRVTKGGKRDLLGDLFGREEAVNFILPLLANMDKYRADRAEALAAEGQVALDFENRMKTPGAIMARLFASLEELNLTVGDELVPGLMEFVTAVTPMIDGVSDFVKANGELTAAVIEITAALIGLRLLASASGMGGALLGMNGGKGADDKSGNGKPGGRTAGKGLAWWGFAGFNALQIAQDYLAAGDGIKMRPDGMSDEDWAAQTKPAADALTAQNQAIEDALLNFDVGGFKPFQALDNIANPTGGIAGGYTGATNGQIEAMKGEIAKLDAEIADWPEAALEERRARLVEKLAGMEAELAASGTAVTSELAATLARMRVLAAAGVTIPLRTTGPYLNAPNRMIDAPTTFRPPSMPTRAPASGNQATVVNNSFGPVVVQNPTNANPKQIANLMGEEVGKRVRSAHTNGGMG